MQKGFLALMSAALLFSCSQIEPFEMDKNEVLRSSSSEDYCVPSFPMDAVTVYTNNAFGVTVTARNDANNTYWTITRSTGNMTVRVATPGIAETQTTGPTILDGGTTVTVPVAHPSGWERGDLTNISFYVSGLGGGSINTFQTGIIQYNLRDICDDCEDSLTTELTCGDDEKVLLVTFTAAEEGNVVIQGGLTNGAIITSAESNILTRNRDHSSVQNSNASVTRWEGNVGACQPVTITIKYTGGNGIGDWSAKRGDEVLGSTEEKEC